MHKYKAALIGCGRISYKHIQAAIDNFAELTLVAVCDILENNAKNKAQQYVKGIQEKGNTAVPDVRVYTDYQEMLRNEEIDIIAIATESGFHAEEATYCMNQRKHVLVEKPMALSTEDANLMIETAKINFVKLGVCHQNRFNAPIQKLREAIEAGRFGKLISGNARILWNRNRDYYDQAPWRGTYELDGGCLMNQCIHNIDLLQWMLGGEIKWVNGDVGNFMHPYIEAEDYGSIQVKFANGSVGNVEGTICVYPKNLEETLTVIGEKGIVAIGGLAVNKIESWRFADGLDDEEQVIEECNGEVENVYGNGHTPLYKDFVDAVKNDRKPYISGEDGKKAMEIILSAYQSSRDEKRINYPLGKLASVNLKKYIEDLSYENRNDCWGEASVY
jgi:UDP-N-acetyl-2-amino-2-deoxyglucuronate dehydrogenase